MEPRDQQRVKLQIAISLLISSMIVLQATAALGADAPTPVLVALSDTYEVPDPDQETVRLGEFAEIIALEPELRDRFTQLAMLEAPEVGKTSRVTRTQVIRMARRAGLPYGRLRFEGARTLNVLGPGQTIRQMDILEAIKQDVLAEHEWSEDELSLQALSVPSGLRMPVGEVELGLFRTSQHAIGVVRYDLTLLVDKKEIKHQTVVVEVGHLRPVWVLTKKLERGDVITADHLRLQNRRMLNERADEMTIEDPAEIAGLKLRRNLSRGVVLTRDLFGKHLLVKRGDEINLFVHTGGVRLHVRGTAQQNGGPGEVIKVKNEANGETVDARILNRSSAEII